MEMAATAWETYSDPVYGRVSAPKAVKCSKIMTVDDIL